MKYKVVEAAALRTLEELVTHCLNHGWIPIGPAMGSWGQGFYQTMYHEGDEDAEGAVRAAEG